MTVKIEVRDGGTHIFENVSEISVCYEGYRFIHNRVFVIQIKEIDVSSIEIQR